MTGRLHELAFEDDLTEEAKPQTCFQQDLKDLYETHKTPEKPLVAYKGGRVVNDALEELGIENINLEHWGCPKIETLVTGGMEPEEDCGHYETEHCAAVKCDAFRQWLQWAKKQEALYPTLGYNDPWH